jgi:hypothetical protein
MVAATLDAQPGLRFEVLTARPDVKFQSSFFPSKPLNTTYRASAVIITALTIPT